MEQDPWMEGYRAGRADIDIKTAYEEGRADGRAEALGDTDGPAEQEQEAENIIWGENAPIVEGYEDYSNGYEDGVADERARLLHLITVSR